MILYSRIQAGLSRFGKIVLPYIVLSLLSMASVGFTQTPKQSHAKKIMENRLYEIMEERAEQFLDHIITQERYIYFNNSVLTKEIKERKKEGQNLSTTFSDQESDRSIELIAQYKKELEKILQIHSEISELEQDPTSQQEEQTRSHVRELKAKLAQLLNSSPLFNMRSVSPHVAQVLARGFNDELTKLSHVLEELDQIQVSSPRSLSIQQKISDLNGRIMASLGESTQGTDSEQVDAYIAEAKRLVNILEELDELDLELSFEHTSAHEAIRNIKQRVYQLIPQDGLLALGYDDAEMRYRSRQLEDHIDLWMSSRAIWILSKRNEIQNQKTELVRSGSAIQVRRMFEDDLNNAISEYNEGNFQTAEMLFQDLIQLYPYKKNDDLRYYYAESLWIQQQFSKAKSAYNTLVREAPQSEYAKMAYYRLMLISETFGNYQEFFEYANQIMRFRSQNTPDEVVDKALIFAGYVGYKTGNFDRALRIISNLNVSSPYYIYGQYLHAVIKLNKEDQHASAIKSLSELVESLASADEPSLQRVKNQAIIKIGLAHYLNDDLSGALETLKKVDEATQGYDVVLLALAWSEFRLGNRKAAIASLDKLFWEYPGSNYLYEAMMLSAHCDRITGDVESSTRKVRYVDNSDESLRLFDEINQERERLGNVLTELNELESRAIKKSDMLVFFRIQNLNSRLKPFTEAISYNPGRGVQFIHEIDEEELALIDLIQKAENDQVVAEALGHEDVSRGLDGIKSRLSHKRRSLAHLQQYEEGDILVDYPLARRESEQKQRLRARDVMLRQIAVEKQRLGRVRRRIQQLSSQALSKEDYTALRELTYRDINLNNLSEELEAIHVNLAENQIELVDSDYTKWADFSGFGASDDDFVRISEIHDEIDRHSADIVIINDAIRHRQDELVYQIAVMDNKIKELENEELRKKIDELKLERQRYFEDEYFLGNTIASDVEAEQELMKMIEGETQPNGENSEPKQNEPQQQDK